MPLSSCPSPWWDDRGFSACVRHRYINRLPAYFIFAALAVYAFLKLYQAYLNKREGTIRLDAQTDKTPLLPKNVVQHESHIAKAENAVFEACAVDEELNILASLNLQDRYLVVDPPVTDNKWSAGAGILLAASWAIPVLLVVSTTQKGHSFAPLLGLSSLTTAAWLSISFRRHTDYLGIFIVCLVYSTLQSLAAFGELRAAHATQQPVVYDALFLVLSLIQLVALLGTSPADVTVQKRLKHRTPTAPPEMTKPSLLSLAYLYYIFDIVKRSATTPGGIEPPLLTPDLSTAYIMARFRAMKHTGTLTRRLLHFLFVDWTLQVVWCALGSFSSVGPLFFLRALLTELALPQPDRTKAAILAILIPAAQALKAVFDNLALLKGRHMCVKAKAICSGEIYAKTLRRQDIAKPADDESSSSAGRISNMISADVAQISDIFAYLHFLFPSVPIVVGIDLWLLFDTLGKSAFIGIAVLLALLPFQFAIGRLYNILTRKILAASDKRLHLLQEVLHSIRLIRFFAWSDSFSERLARARKVETNLLIHRSILDSAAELIYMSNATLIGILTFYFHTQVFGNTLSAASAFTTLAAFDMLKHPMELIADMLAGIFQAGISLGRISSYLEEPDTPKWDDVQEPTDSRVGFSNATFDWGTDGTFELKNLDMVFPEGKLSLIAGTVGSGKSALLLSLLGETRCVRGRRYLPSALLPEEAPVDPNGLTRTVAYCSQTAFLLSDAVRSNILFGTEWDEVRYRKVIRQCALTQDLQQLPAGDQTLIGERGTVLSGGQKMRVALARALYSRARTLLLDDVLAAVDAQTAHLLVKTLGGDLVKDRTCILVTHSLPLCLPAAHHVVVLDKGSVQFSGPPSEASASLGIEYEPVQPEETNPLGEAHLAKEESSVDLNKSVESRDEVRSAGAVSWGVYSFYLKARGNIWTWIIILSAFGLSQLFDALASASLAQWAKSYDVRRLVTAFMEAKSWMLQKHEETTLTAADDSPQHYMRVYIGLSLAYVALLAFRGITFRISTIFAARKVYDRLSAMVLGAQMRFFDTTPVGQVVNRMSRDTKVVDSEIGKNLNFLIYEIVAFIVVLLAIAYTIPKFLIVAAATAIVYLATIQLYLRGSREFKRLESVTRSPIFSLFGETMNGSITIRAYSSTSRFLKHALHLQNENSRPFYTLWLTNRWLSINTELESAATILGIALTIVLLPGLDSSTAGFCLSLGLRLPERFLWMGRLSADVEIAANSIERVQEYMDLPQEDNSGRMPPAHWPTSKGGVQVKNLEAFYGPDMPPVLKKISFDIAPRSKVAIVGRTGSGKSTLALAFFRFIMTSGSIVIDGLDINTLVLEEVRRRLTIIAQDATLFSGTIRSNLDPFGEHEDVRLWDVLQRVKLSGTGSEQDPLADKAVTSLEQEVAEGGNNLSQGQRQLVALARGLLKLHRSKLLILDEASASLDAATDAFIQRTLREELNDATLICIAHRLDTVIDYDKILVLGDGEILEYDTPRNLMERPDGHFAKLARQAGEVEFQRLKALTKG